MSITSKKLILIVCTGNTCRSPIAEILLRTAIEKDALSESYQVSSAGIYASDGQTASENAQKVMQAKSCDLSNHSAQQVTQELVKNAELILTMTQSHRLQLASDYPENSSKIHLFRSFFDQGDSDVMDPFGGNLDDYAHCAKDIEAAIPSILNYLKQG